jgi:hypothetical protein
MAAWSVLRITQRGDLVVAKTDPPMQRIGGIERGVRNPTVIILPFEKKL